ncbi:MAG TPA: signal peptide peptidase SppA [Streptosporangiaceae bacterium]|jgi:protease-4|nr:signal peptide peptidase SppA [Streptosporangiaceae bacterium]
MADAKLAWQLTEQVSRLRQRQSGPLILELDLTDGIGEEPVTDPVAAFMSRRKIRLPDIIEGLRRARQDDRVRALVVKVGGGRIGLARMQEIREAVSGFRESGKLTVAWAETFGEFTHGNVPYYLATAFDRIYLQPSGTLGLTGVAVEQLFLHDALAKIGIDFQSAKRYEYKSAADNLTERGFTPPAREASERLAASIAEQISAAIAERRGKTAGQARALLDRGPFLAADALAEGLVDALGYRDEVYADVRKEAGADATLQYVARYQRSHLLAQRARRLPRGRERFVAVIYASGPIRQGRSTRSPVGGSAMGSDTVAAALRSVLSDERARAVLLRVNSPGGSATASDTIWREVVRLRAAGKPVVVSMSDVAASGGYFISAPADVIVAQPGTITGSIGVIMGKPVLAGALERVGITTDSVAVGSGATMLAPTHPFTEDEWSRINIWLDAIYQDFIGKVASGRRMPVEQVHEVARGRVWTGADAAQNGLVDELGGMAAAAEIARRRAGLPADAPLRVYPRLTPLDQLRPPESSESRPAAAAGLDLGFADAFSGWGPAWRLAAQAGLPPYGPLMLPGKWTII